MNDKIALIQHIGTVQIKSPVNPGLNPQGRSPPRVLMKRIKMDPLRRLLLFELLSENATSATLSAQLLLLSRLEFDSPEVLKGTQGR